MKKLLLLFVGVLLALPTLARDFSYTYEGQTLIYTVIDEGAKTCQTKDGYRDYYGPFDFKNVAGNQVSGNLVIPSVAKNGATEYTVTSIGEYAFVGNYLTSVTIPNSVTSIDRYAFQDCNWLNKAEFESLEALCKINFGDSYANPLSQAHNLYLNGEEVTEVVIPESITSIGSFAFAGCSSLTKAEFASIEALCKMNFGNIDANPLYYAHNLYINGEETAQIVIPETVTSIGNYAFAGCRNMESVTIPNSVTEIGSGAFYDCRALTNIDFASIETLCKINFGNSSANPLSNIHHLYVNGEEITDLVIPESVTSIGSYTFSGCTYLTSVTIPNSVTEIGSGTFSNCSGMTSVRIGNSVTAIGDNAFNGCSSLTEITIGNSVTTIGNDAFSRCSGLTSVTIPNSVNTIGNGAFNGCSSVTEITIGNSVTKIGNSAFDGCTSLKEITIADGEQLLYLGDGRLDKYYYEERYEGGLFCETSLEKLYLGRNIYRTGYYNPFSRLQTLKNLTIGNSVTEIGSYAFSECTGLTAVTIGSSVSTIGDRAFDGCTGLTSVNLQDVNKWSQVNFYDKTSNPIYYTKKFSVGDSDKTVRHLDLDLGDKSVSPYAFYNAQNLATVRVKCAAIGENAFTSCPNVQKICLDIDALSENCFADNINLGEVYSLTEEPPTAFDNSFGLYRGVKLYVPEESVEKYRNAENCWWNFFDVYGSDFTDLDSIFKADYENSGTGIDEIGVEKDMKDIDYAAAYEVYNLNGLKVGDSTDNLAPGIYIIRQGNRTQKIVVR